MQHKSALLRVPPPLSLHPGLSPMAVCIYQRCHHPNLNAHHHQKIGMLRIAIRYTPAPATPNFTFTPSTLLL